MKQAQSTKLWSAWCRHPHRFNELATKSEQWHAKHRLACFNVWHPSLKTVDVLPWTCKTRSEGKWLSRQTSRQSNHHKWLASWKIHSMQAQSQGHHTTDRLEERGVERVRLTIFTERTRKVHHQSDRQRNRFKDKAGKLPMGWQTYGLFWMQKYHFELNWTCQLWNLIAYYAICLM